MGREKNIVFFLLLLAFLIIVIWVGIYYVQYRNGKSQMQEERYHNIFYLDLLKRAIINNIFSTEKIEDFFYEKLSEAVEITFSLQDITDESLKKYAEIMQLDQISIVDQQNNIVNSSLPRKQYEYQLDLLELENDESVVLTLPSISDKQAPAMVYVLKKDALFYLSSVKESIIRQFIKDISLNALIDFATASYQESRNEPDADIHLQYIVIQDSLGILSATDNVQSISKIENDAFLGKLIRDQVSRSRIIEFAGREINETVMPFQLENYDFGVIRMGTHLVRLNKAAARRKLVVILFSIIFTIFLFLEYLVYLFFKKYKASVQHLNQAIRFREIANLGGEVAHEIKNPLNALNMIMQRLRSEFRVIGDNDNYNKMLEISSNELNRLNGIIEKFLSYSRLQDLHIENIRISDLIESVIELFQDTAVSQGIKLAAYCSPDLHFRLDPDKIKQVLINLVKNSQEAMNKAQPIREIDLIAVKTKKKLIIKVRDNGTGINEEQIDKVWDLYYTTKKNGSGIGLSFSRKIVEAHNGNMEIKSEAGSTEVTVSLPEPE